jgi:signal transduction histidine kinase
LTDSSLPGAAADIPIRILTVDDEETIVEEIVDSLVLQHIDVKGLISPREALDTLAADPKITVLMTDLDMPGLTGLQLAEQALVERSDENALEVVLLTAHANLDSAIDAMRIGVFDLLRKPARLVTLRDTLERAHRKAVERRRRHRAAAASKLHADTAPARNGNDAEALSGHGGSFLSAISHELRTPLNPIIGFSQLIEQKSPEDGEIKEYARYIREAGESLFDLTESVLKVTELRTKPPKIVKEWVRPSELLARLRDQRQKAARARRQRIEIEDCAQQLINTDGDLLVQALDHLLANAIAFSHEDTVIRLGVHPGNGELSLFIADSGPGMTSAEIVRALQPFEQLDLRHARANGGLGVGLTLASLMAGCLGGRLDISSRPGEGTTVSIWVPLPGRSFIQ